MSKLYKKAIPWFVEKCQYTKTFDSLPNDLKNKLYSKMMDYVKANPDVLDNFEPIFFSDWFIEQEFLNDRIKLNTEVSLAFSEMKSDKYKKYEKSMIDWINGLPVFYTYQGKNFLCDVGGYVITTVFDGRDFVEWFLKSYGNDMR